MKYNITPTPKPRMTVSDKWKKRPVVLKYFSFKDEVRRHKIEVDVEGCFVTFGIPMPKSWSHKKRKGLLNKPHQQKPDVDNLLKALLDAVYDDDSVVWSISVKKIWGDIGFIEIEN